MLHQGTQLKKCISILHFTHALGKHLERPIILPLCVCTRTHVCVCYCTFYSTFVLIPQAFIESLPSTASSPVLIVAATNHDKYLRPDNEYLLAI